MLPEDIKYKIFEQLGGIASDVKNIKDTISDVKQNIQTASESHNKLSQTVDNVRHDVVVLKKEQGSCIMKRQSMDQMVHTLRKEQDMFMAVKLSWKQWTGFMLAIMPGIGAFVIQIYHILTDKGGQ